MLSDLFYRFRALFHRKAVETELDEELRYHLDREAEKYRQVGDPEEEAMRRARLALGGPEQVRQQCREARGTRLLEDVFHDLHFGMRMLVKSPGFTAVALLTLALAVGANTAVFSLINGLLLRPLPVPHAEQLVVVRYDRSDLNNPNYAFSAPMFRALEHQHEAFRDVAAYAPSTLQVRGSSGNVEVPGALVSGQFFGALETQPLLGRYLTPEDDRAGGAPSGFGVVISEGFWRTWFNSSPDVLGRSLKIANASFTVVGVMPKQFIGADPTQRLEMYVPLFAEPLIHAPYNLLADGYHSQWLHIIARRNSGVSLEQANAALQSTLSSVLDEAIPDAKWIRNARNHHLEVVAEPGSKGFSYLRSAFEKPLVAVFSLCSAMLLLACLNLASLLMARGAARERELATRLAIGATRRRLIQQLLVESLLIAALGTTAGLAVSPIVSRSLAALLLGNNRNAILDTTLDLRAFLFAALIAGIASLLIGLIPALRATSGNLNDYIKDGSHATSARERARLLPRILMALEVALAMILMVGAGLITTSLTQLYRTELGFDPKGLVNLDLAMGKQSLTGDALLRWYQTLGDSLGHLPGIKAVSFESVIPLSGSMWTDDLHTPSSNGDRNIYWNAVAPEYFATMRIPLLDGRDFRWTDTEADGKKIVLNQAAAKTLFPGQNAIGQQVAAAGNKSYEVIAVVGDARYTSIREVPPASAYVPITQKEEKKPSYTAVLRVEGSVAPLASAARSITARMAPEIPAPVMTTMSSDLDDSISSERMMALLSVFFAGCALLVTAIGLYGTLSYAAGRRTSEIGIRMALGAQRTQVVGLIFRENAWIAAGGSLAGLLTALLASRVLASFMYGISVHDPWVMIIAVLALGTVASAASAIPAIRASRIEPITAIRYE